MISWTEHRTNEEVLEKVSRRKKIFNGQAYNQNKAEELDWTHSKRQLSTDNGRKDGLGREEEEGLDKSSWTG